MASTVKHTFFDIDRIWLHLLVYPNNGPATLFLHANGLNAGTYTPLFAKLTNRLYLVAGDLPGHGQSGPPAGNPIRSWITFVSDLQQLITRYFDPPVNVVGHSLGGVVAYLAAARFPLLIRRIVMIDPPVFLPRPRLKIYSLIRKLGFIGQFPIVKAARRRRYLFDAKHVAVQRFMSGKGMFKTWRKSFIHAYIDSALDFSRLPGRLRCHPEIEAQIFSSMPTDAWIHAPKIKCPVLLLRGQNSNAFSAKSAQRLSHKIPDCRLETITDTTHFLPMEEPGRVASAILNHLAA